MKALLVSIQYVLKEETAASVKSYSDICHSSTAVCTPQNTVFSHILVILHLTSKLYIIIVYYFPKLKVSAQ